MKRWRLLGLRQEQEEQLDKELRFHIEERISDLRAAGVSEDEARRMVRHEFGGVEQVKEECRDARGTRWLGDLWRDFRYALRTLRRSPGFSASALVTLTLGIGANTTIFNVVDQVLLRPLPIQNPDRLLMFHGTKRDGSLGMAHSFLDYADFQSLSDVFSGVVAFSPLPLGLQDGKAPERVWGELVSGNYFSVLGVQAIHGRMFLPVEDRDPGAHPVVVISYALWRRSFAGDPNIIGQTIAINTQPFTVIGIAPQSFQGIALRRSPADIWVPLAMQVQLKKDEPWPNRSDRDHRWLSVAGRLQPGLNQRESQSAVDLLTGRLALEYAESNDGRGVRLEPVSSGNPQVRGKATSVLAVMMVVSGLVLLIACVNMANLLIGRSAARQREWGIRFALGSGRLRLIRQLLTESVLLSLLGGGCALFLSDWFLRLLSGAQLPAAVPFHIQPGTDSRVLAFAFIISALTGVLFGFTPALRSSRPDIVPLLKNESSARVRFGGTKLRELLVILQIALSLVLLISTGLFVRSLEKAQAVEIGFRPDHVLMLSIDPSLYGYSDAQSKALLVQLQRRVAALPGVQAASFTDRAPLSLGANEAKVQITGRQFPRESNVNRVTYFTVAPRYFVAIGMPLLHGREFSDRDGPLTPLAIVNRSMADRFWPSEDVLGKHVLLSGKNYEIVGIVPDSKLRTFAEDATPCIYLPILQTNSNTPLTMLVRTTADPAGMAAGLTKEVRAVAGNIAVYQIESLEEHVGQALVFVRVGARLFSAFGLTALLLASIGLYGVMSYSVTRRTHEIGVRIALGARPRDVRRMILIEATGLACAGIGIGLIGAFALCRLLTAFLYGVTATDGQSFGGAALVLFGVAMISSYLPVRRATRVDPLVAVRCE